MNRFLFLFGILILFQVAIEYGSGQCKFGIEICVFFCFYQLFLYPDPPAPSRPCPPIAPKPMMGPCIFNPEIHCKSEKDCNSGEQCCASGCYSMCI